MVSMNESAFSPAQIVGYVAFVTGIVSFAQKSDKRLKGCLAVQGFVYAIHFCLLHNFAACGNNAVSVVRNTATIWTRATWVAMLLLIMTAGVAMFTVHEPKDMVTVVASVVAIWGMFRLDGIPLRLCLLCCTALWLTNNLLCHSYGGIALETTIGATNLATIVRLRAHEQRKGALEAPVA